MTLDSVLELLNRRPFEPFRIVNSGGESYQTRHPEMAWPIRDGLFGELSSRHSRLRCGRCWYSPRGRSFLALRISAALFHQWRLVVQRASFDDARSCLAEGMLLAWFKQGGNHAEGQRGVFN